MKSKALESWDCKRLMSMVSIFLNAKKLNLLLRSKKCTSMVPLAKNRYIRTPNGGSLINRSQVDAGVAHLKRCQEKQLH